MSAGAEEKIEAAEFRDRWESYANGLGRLRRNLDDDQENVLDDVQDQLRQLIHAATDNLEDNR